MGDTMFLKCAMCKEMFAVQPCDITTFPDTDPDKPWSHALNKAVALCETCRDKYPHMIIELDMDP